MSTQINVMIPSHFQDFINAKIKNGRFNNTTEIILFALHNLEDDEKKSEMFRDAMKNGSVGIMGPNMDDDLLKGFN